TRSTSGRDSRIDVARIRHTSLSYMSKGPERERRTNGERRGPRGRTGARGPKGEPGPWPSAAYDLLQGQIDEIRRDLDQLRERLDYFDETRAHGDDIRIKMRRNG